MSLNETTARRLGISLDDALIFGGVHNAILVAAAAGTIDLNQLARTELANRGLGADGRWVGFAEAARIHGVT